MGITIKKNDIILAVSLVVIAIICAVYIQFFVKKDGNQAVVSIDGQVYQTLDLNINNEFEFNGVEGYNILVIENGNAFMKDANCPDKNCVRQGKVNKVGETIVCLPHKVVIEIIGENTELDGVVE